MTAEYVAYHILACTELSGNSNNILIEAQSYQEIAIIYY